MAQLGVERRTVRSPELSTQQLGIRSNVPDDFIASSRLGLRSRRAILMLGVDGEPGNGLGGSSLEAVFIGKFGAPPHGCEIFPGALAISPIGNDAELDWQVATGGSSFG